MKYKDNILEYFKTSPFFTKDEFVIIFEKFNIKKSTIDAYINQLIKHRKIIPLKKGLYTHAKFYEKNISDISYKFLLANISRKPSYISSWSALQYYGLTTESIMSTTCVTTKKTITFSNKLGGFSYNSIKDTLFNGFVIEKGKFEFAIASPSKALFDLLYFKTNQFKSYYPKLIEELRIDIDEMDKTERKKFEEMVKKITKK